MPAPDPEGSPESAEPERKVVSVLFVDLVGFTPLSERLDAEDVATIQRAYFDAVRAVVSRHGGVVDKYIGDAVMAVFGVPRVREDDAARAVAAGLALTGAVEGIATSLGLGPGELEVRVAVNSGEVVQRPNPSPETGYVTGDVVNVAARLQSEAEPGRVIVGPLTALLAADAAELDAPRQLAVKGKAEPVAGAHVRAMRPHRSREHAMGSLRAPLVGRDAEMEGLEQAAAAALAGTSTLVALVAAPGSGKSRLLSELAQRRTGAQPVLEAVVRPDALLPFDAVAQLLAAALHHAGLAPAEGDKDLAEHVARLLRRDGRPSARARVLAGEVAALLRPDAHAVAADPDRDRRFGDWIEALRGLCPYAVWLLDDVHWASADLRAFVLAAAAGDGGALIVAAARPALLIDHEEWRERAHVLELAPLAPAPAALLARRLVGDAIPVALSDRIAAASDGNPLFIEELLRSWAGSGLLEDHGGGWRLPAEPETIDLPAGVRAVYAGQLDDLPDSARALARRAAVAGRRFPVAALSALGVADAAAGLATLERRGLISGAAADPVVGATHTFRHALLRETAYGTLARAERARLHVGLAHWLGERERGGGETAELAGRHLETALREAPALGRELAPGLDRDAVRASAAAWFERAAQAAAAGTARETAAGLLRRALDLTAAAAVSDRVRRLRLLGESLISAGDMTEAGDALAAALALHEAADPADRHEYAAAAAALARVRHQQIRFRESAGIAATARARLGDRDDAATGGLMLAQGLAEIAETDDPARARLLEGALAIARSDRDPDLELRALEALTALGLGGQAAEEAAWREVERLAATLGRPETRASAISSAAFARRLNGGAPEPDALWPAVELADAHGLIEQRAWLDYVGAEVGLLDDDRDKAVRLALSAIARGEAKSYSRLIVRSWFVALPVLAERPGDGRDLRRAARFFDDFEHAGVPDSPYARIVVPAARLDLAAAGVGETAPPEPGARMDSFRLAYATPSWTLAVERVIGSWLAAGWLDAVDAAITELHVALGSVEATPLLRASVHLLQARLLSARGEPAAAIREQADLAAAAARQAHAPLWERAARALTP